MYICRILHMTCDCTKNVDMQSYHLSQPLGLFLRGTVCSNFFRSQKIFHCLHSTCCFTCIHEISHVVNTLKSQRYEEGRDKDNNEYL